MTVTGHVDRSVFQRYNVRRDDVQAAALDRQESYLTRKRGTRSCSQRSAKGGIRDGPFLGFVRKPSPRRQIQAQGLSERRLEGARALTVRDLQ